MRLSHELVSYAEHIVNWAPGSVGYRLRRWFFGRRFRRLGPNAVIGMGLIAYGPHNITAGAEFSCWRLCTLAACEDGAIEIGDRVSLNANVYVNACNGGRIAIGSDVMIGPNTMMRTSDHEIENVDIPVREQGHRPAEIVLENNVWIGANVCVLGGVRIGEGAVIEAGAVVTRDVEPRTVAGGVPARLIKRR